MASVSASGSATGSATASATAGVKFLFSGTASGVGKLQWGYLYDTSPVAVGVGTTTAAASRIRLATGHAKGLSSLLWSYPHVALGVGVMTCEPLVERSVPLCETTSLKTFEYLHTFRPGDLEIEVYDARGPVIPVWVAYTLFQIRPDGSRKQIGPSNLVPVHGSFGHFYATGRAGESGQPGTWLIRWEISRTFQSNPEIREMMFQVHDAVLTNDPSDSTPRCTKYGWT